MNNMHKCNPEQNLINQIHSAMKLKRQTLADVAQHIGVSYIHMASMSSGARKVAGLRIEKQRALASFIGISMIEFYLLCGLLSEEDVSVQ